MCVHVCMCLVGLWYWYIHNVYGVACEGVGYRRDGACYVLAYVCCFPCFLL